jgi:hypothetical protein
MPTRRTTRKQASRQIAATIRRLHRADEPLNIMAVKRRHPQLIKRGYAMRPFLG